MEGLLNLHYTVYIFPISDCTWKGLLNLHYTVYIFLISDRTWKGFITCTTLYIGYETKERVMISMT